MKKTFIAILICATAFSAILGGCAALPEESLPQDSVLASGESVSSEEEISEEVVTLESESESEPEESQTESVDPTPAESSVEESSESEAMLITPEAAIENADPDIHDTLAEGSAECVQSVNVRSLPQMEDSEVIGVVEEGTVIEILETVGSWYRIEYEGQTGYVYSGFFA